MEMDVSKYAFAILLLILSGTLRAQNEKFYIDQSNISISEALKEMESKTGKRIVYSDDIISSDRKVSIKGNYTLSGALHFLFKDTDIGFSYSDDKVILHRVAKKKNKHVLSGYIREKGSNELLPLANVYLPELQTGVSSNNYGFYSIELPEDSVSIVFSYAGVSQRMQLKITSDQEMNIDLPPYTLLKEVTVVSSDEKESETVEVGHIDLPANQVKNMQFVLGEKDVFKALQLLPGVKRGKEGSSGFYVRGGGSDQNLILLDDAPVYNANHLFGFFSPFNGNAIKGIDFYKGGFPSRYGGRLSSVLDMRMKEGNQNEMHGEASIGFISSSMTLEGPIKKNKISAMISARRTYIDVLAKPLLDPWSYYFYDVNAKINFNINPKNKVYLSGYFGKDDLNSSNSNSTNNYVSINNYSMLWGNQTATLRWNHEFSNKVFGNASLIYSNYKLKSASDQSYNDTTYHFKYFTAIRDWNIKYDLDVFASPNHHLRSGLNFIAHRFNPGALIVKEQTSINFKDLNNPIYNFETGLYAEDEWKPTHKLTFNFGIRFSGFNSSFSGMKLNPEPRVTTAYQFHKNWAIKAGYSQMYQYIHLLSNTGIGLPTDLWVPSTAKVPYEGSSQQVIGIVHDLPGKGISISVEAYSKKMNNIINYKPGTSFLAIDQPSSEQYVSWEDKVTSGQGWSSGVEMLIQKKVGRLNGWIGYTLSKTELQFDDINFGKKFYASYDRRHDLSVVAMYALTERITLSGTWIYQSGNRVTVPQNQYTAFDNGFNSAISNGDNGWSYYYGSSQSVIDYGSKNSFLTPAYHRLDIGIQFHKKKRKYERTWGVGLYNAYYRKNPLYYEVVMDSNHDAYLRGVNVFPVIPSFSYQIKF